MKKKEKEKWVKNDDQMKIETNEKEEIRIGNRRNW